MQEKQTEAGQVLLKFLHSIIFKKRLKRLRIFCIRQTECELFSPFEITDRMCGVCGVSFEKTSAPPKTPPSAEGEKEMDEQDEEEEEEEEVVMARLNQAHMISEEHRMMTTNFQIFREMFRNFISLPLMEIGAFLSKYQVESLSKYQVKSLSKYQVESESKYQVKSLSKYQVKPYSNVKFCPSIG